MISELRNPDYDSVFIMEEIATHSELFKGLLLGLVNDTNNEYPTNSAWLGTLNHNDQITQIKLTVTQEPEQMIDED